jgi:agmatine deiminase
MGLRLPADWEPHERCLMAWPGHGVRPQSLSGDAKHDFAHVARTIAEFEPVVMIADPGFGPEAESACGPGIEIVELTFDDVFIRDSGPLFAVRDGAELVAVDFRFNLWGSKRVRRTHYASTGRTLAQWLGAVRIEAPFVLEGGSVTTNGEGTLIAVATSVLNENRNPGVRREEIEASFAEHLGIERTIWLELGLVEDWTDGHADNVAVFVSPGRVLCQTVTDQNDANAARLAANRATLEAAGLEVVELPVLPYACHERRIALSYLNSFVGNNCVVVPLAGVAADAEGLAVLEEAWPSRDVVGVPGETLARIGGGVHCITQQVPLLAGEQ